MALTVVEMDRQQMAKHHHFHWNFFSNMLVVGTYRGVRPNNIQQCIYWAWSPIRGHEVVRGGVNIIRGVYVSK